MRDPVSGRPLHEFVVDPLRAPSALATQDDPLVERGVPQIPHGKQPRRQPIMVFNVDRDADLAQAAKDIAKAVIEVQRRQPGR